MHVTSNYVPTFVGPAEANGVGRGTANTVGHDGRHEFAAGMYLDAWILESDGWRLARRNGTLDQRYTLALDLDAYATFETGELADG